VNGTSVGAVTLLAMSQPLSDSPGAATCGPPHQDFRPDRAGPKDRTIGASGRRRAPPARFGM